MLLTRTAEERLSLAYVDAICAKAEVTVAKPSPDVGVDAVFNKVVEWEPGKFRPSMNGLPCQVKATVQWDKDTDEIRVPLDVVAFNKLVDSNKHPEACLLVVFCLPREEAQWLSVDADVLCLRHCCYWYYVTGPRSENRGSQTIRIPQTQLFTPEALVGILTEFHNRFMPNPEA